MKDILMVQIMEFINTKCIIDFESDTPHPEVGAIDDIHMPVYNILNTLVAKELKALRDDIIMHDVVVIRKFVLAVCESEDEHEELVSDILKLKYCFNEKDLADLFSKMYLRNTM
jgi:hypothetical protein